MRPKWINDGLMINTKPCPNARDVTNNALRHLLDLHVKRQKPLLFVGVAGDRWAKLGGSPVLGARPSWTVASCSWAT